MITIYLKNGKKVTIENPDNYNTATILSYISKHGFVRIYNYIIPCDEIGYISINAGNSETDENDNINDIMKHASDLIKDWIPIAISVLPKIMQGQNDNDR